MPNQNSVRFLEEYRKNTQRNSTQEQTPETVAQRISTGLENAEAGPSLLERGMGVLGRTFDVLSRPLYGIAEATSDVITGEDNPLEGFWQGFSGREKTTFSDVLLEAGIDGPLRGIAGFGLDIALDPLTYLSGGLARGLSKTAAEGIAGDAAIAVQKAMTKEGFKNSLVKSAIRDFEASVAGKGITKAERNAGRNAARISAVENASYEAGLKAKDEALSKAVGKVQLRFKGKTVAESEKLYKAGSYVANRVKKTSTGRALNKAFRPVATYGELNPLRRTYESVGMANAEDAAKAFMEGRVWYPDTGGKYVLPAFKDLTSEEAEQITKAIESGFDFGDQLALNGTEMNAYLQAAKDIIGVLGDGEELLGQLKSIDRIDNYIPHYFDYNKSDPLSVVEHKKLRKADIDAQKKAYKEAMDKDLEFSSFTTTQTLEEAKQLGLTPVEDIRDILGQYIKESFVKQGRARWMLAASQEFGIDMGKQTKLARRLGLIKPDNSTLKGLAEIGEISPNTYFPREIADALRQVDKTFYDEAAGAGLLKLYDGALNALKTMQTVVNPGHHIRNLMSDTWLNYLDGVVDPSVYRQSAQTIKQIRRMSNDPAALGSLAPVTIKIGNLPKEVDILDLWAKFVQSGAKSGYYRSEVTKVGKVGFKPLEMIREGSEVREDFIRFAHFLDSIKKEGVAAKSIGDLNKAADRAAQRVRKFNIDYGDLTPFEQRTMKRVVPFYTFMRKNVPLQFENLLMRPGRQTVAPKFIKNLQVAIGQDPNEDVLGFNALPDYMREGMYVKLLGEGEGRNAVYWNPSAAFPVFQLSEIFGGGSNIGAGESFSSQALGDTVEGQLGMLTPFLRAPIEAVSGHDFFTGRQNDDSIVERLLNQTPITRMLRQAFQGELGTTRGASWLATPGVVELTPGQMQGELRRQEDIVQALLRRRREQAAAEQQANP